MAFITRKRVWEPVESNLSPLFRRFFSISFYSVCPVLFSADLSTNLSFRFERTNFDRSYWQRAISIEARERERKEFDVVMVIEQRKVGMRCSVLLHGQKREVT